MKGLLDMLANELQKRNGTLDYFVNSENVGGYRHIVLFVDDPGLLEGHLINRYILPGKKIWILQLSFSLMMKRSLFWRWTVR